MARKPKTAALNANIPPGNPAVTGHSANIADFRSPLEIIYRPIAELIPYARNARTHSAAHVDQLCASMTSFGWTNPVLIDPEGGIIAGHGRVLAARKLAMSEVPTIMLSGLSEAQRRALVIADNKLGLNSGWDSDLLRMEMQSLSDEGFHLDVLGFDATEIAGILSPGTDGLTDPDEEVQPPVIAVSQIGDVWLLGDHRIICGSCTEVETVSAVLGDAKPHLMVTDPPYGVDYDPNWRNEADRANGKAYGASAIGKVENDGRADWREAWALFPGDVAYVWCASLHAHEVADSLIAGGFDLRSQIIWAKTRLLISRGHYHWQHEPCWYAVRKGRTGHWSGDRKQTTLWTIEHAKSETGHGTQKPVEAMRKPIENNSQPGDAVYEPFSGSGTTIIAGEMTGRRVFAIELNPAYVDVAVLRWQRFTGKTAYRESDGMEFAAAQAKAA